jgi:hypothetical protein
MVHQRTGRTMQFDGLANARDLGGLRRADGATSRRPERVSTVAVDLDGLENRQFWTDYWDNGLVGTALYYLPYLQAMPDHAVAALSAIVSAPAGGVLFHCMGGRDRTGLLAMLLLAAIDVDATEIVDDYLETVRRGDLRAAAVNGTNDEAGIEALCRRHGTSTTDAFADAVRGLDLERVLTDGGMSPEHGRALSTW